MDMNLIRGKTSEFLKKYRYVILVVILGIVLMSIPGKKEKQSETVPDASAVSWTDPTEELTRILSQIQGAGKVKVLLTLSAGEKTVYQTDTDGGSASGGVRHETVIVTDGDRAQHGLIQQIQYPQYRGAVVVCQGADQPAVKLAITEAVSNATGLGTDKISVLKMK